MTRVKKMDRLTRKSSAQSRKLDGLLAAVGDRFPLP
jgi:hypothetical protein